MTTAANFAYHENISSEFNYIERRLSGYTLAIKNMDKTAKGTALTLISTVKGYEKHIKSITFDQGSEFQRYDWIQDCLEAEIYFCEPEAPEQKGAIENVNKEYRLLVDMLYIADWVMHSHELINERSHKGHEDLYKKIKSYYREMGKDWSRRI